MITSVEQSDDPVIAERTEEWHADFVRMLPVIRREASYQFRKLPAGEQEEAIAEVVASACVAYRRLVEARRAHVTGPRRLAQYAASQRRGGRRVGSPRNIRDLTAPRSRHGRRWELVMGNCRWENAFIDEKTTAIPDQVAFRVDFAEWLAGQPRRDRRIVKALAMGNRPSDVIDRFRLSRGRISQLRREWETSWHDYQAEEDRKCVP